MTFLTAEEVQRIGNAIGLKGKFLCDWGTDHIFDILDPPPEIEEVDAHLWVVVDSNTGRIWNTGTKEDMEIACSPDPTNQLKIIKLTGTFTRPVPAKVKRKMVANNVNWSREDNNSVPCGDIDDLQSDIIYWHDLPGKHGKLTFEWQEDAK